jgi:uncharacterized repeat protein (TIGR01451 family)
MYGVYKAILSISAMGCASAVLAQSPIQLSSNIYVEKIEMRADGATAVTLETPAKILPGDQLVFVVRYKNVGHQAASGLTVTNPIPRAIRFNGTSDGTEIVSVDGGKNWGPLGQLKVAGADGKSRPALMTDVTHLQWRINQSLAAGAAGKLIFRGVVK